MQNLSNQQHKQLDLYYNCGIKLRELFNVLNELQVNSSEFITALNNIDNFFPDPRIYVYKGDKLTDKKLVGLKCIAFKKDGKCIVSKMRTMKVMFQNGETQIILLRKLKRINK